MFWIFPEIQRCINVGFIDSDNLASPAYAIALAMTSVILAISPVTTSYLPVGTILYIVALFTLSTKLFTDYRYVFIIAFYAAWDSTLITNYNMTFYSLSHPLFVIFLLIVLKQYESKKITLETTCCMLLLYLGVFYIHPESPLWMILALCGVYLSLIIGFTATGKLSLGKPTNGSKFVLLAIVFIVIYITWNRLFFNDWLPHLNDIDFGDTLTTFIASKFDRSVYTTGYAGQLFSNYYNYSRLAQYVMIFGLILMGTFQYVRDKLTRADSMQIMNPTLVIGIIFILTAVVDALIYSIEGWISLKFVNLTFPILALISLKYLRISEKGKNVVLTIFIVIVSIGGISLIGEFVQNWSTTCDDVEQGSSWILAGSNNPAILTDVPTYTKLLVASSVQDLPFSPVYYTLDTYKQVIEAVPSSSTAENSTHADYNYVVVDKKNINRAIGALGNRYYEPLSHHYSAGLISNPKLSKIYSDDKIEVFRAG